MRKEDKVYLKHILESISNIENSTKDLSKGDFKKNLDVRDAVVRRLEIIGEAVKNLSDEFKEKYKEIEWKKIAGTRDVLIHAYFAVDLDLVWKIANDDMLRLKENIKGILET